ncbi:TPA: hypothetical protein ACV5ZF_002519 [Salmonella enterica]|uniref:Uncharacterized protein n=1 Tax=Salmonella enterica subsp. salamae serovar 42:r:- TaxID=2500152 RepID=A0A731R7V9_SALER|nr:hypothetical protein [Salmonella enterica]EDP8674841.1 hypothetical protein [Salmonella enterica subsp. salamae]HCM1852079.1 hypothetical protein [Salmonella enterica subsp. salamae serovar 42:z29:-]EDR0102507.1 hypothetical protein [Salmonella enterica subsp. salamae]EDV1289988.1 hypothetical protein [Salmonella enterica subsp. salamae]EDW9232383.1 hypothetical protein [Salmonella enterica]
MNATVFIDGPSDAEKRGGYQEQIISGFMNEMSFILLDYAIDKSLPGRLIQVIAKGG